MKSVIVLLSGGIDSAVVLAMLRDHRRRAVAFDYGQNHAIELERARVIAAREDVEIDAIKIPQIRKLDAIVFAARNAILISLAASLAKSIDFQTVAIGCNRTDWELFPDCRPSFIASMGSALRAYDVVLMAPLLNMTKREVVALARELGVPLDLTWSCYSPRDRTPCGECLACRVRREAGA